MIMRQIVFLFILFKKPHSLFRAGVLKDTGVLGKH